MLKNPAAATSIVDLLYDIARDGYYYVAITDMQKSTSENE